MGDSQSSLKGKELEDHNWNHATRILSVIAASWFILNVIGILAFAILVDQSSDRFTNIFRRLVGYGRNFPLGSGYRKLKDINTRIDLLQDQVTKMSAQEQTGGSRKKSYSINSFMVYFNICFVLACAVFLTIYPSYLTKQQKVFNSNVPSFSID